MSLRSKVIIAVHTALAEAAKEGYGLRLSQLKICGARIPFGVIWELRRHGAETIAVRRGRQVVGWILKSELGDTPRRADEPTPQSYIEYNPKLFKGGYLPQKKRARLGKIYSPLGARPLTVAAKKLIHPAA